ncbi:eIF2A-related protein [Ktedonospora formicarum]|uniref:Zinc-ribbon domain-containing protein n=1 Tax=Ktedonospora formicarum TaxID=2778364 RepID=A0A8J3MWW9_9CHLR|nr:hypothetical protein [Ktedonospora formicarum]GHO49108.1 hypothetical protein KSX_72710 [Ktedonospora formicarum]
MIQASGRVCATCGTALAPNATFCSRCGQPYHPTPEPHNGSGVAPQAYAGYNTVPSTNTPGIVRKRSRTGLIITILLLLAIIGGSLFVFVLPRLQQSNSTTSKSDVPAVPHLPDIKAYTYSGHTSVVWQVAWSPNGKLIASSGGLNDESVQIWNAETGKKQARFQDSAIVNAVAWSPDSKYVASGGSSDTVDVLNATSGERVMSYKGHKDAILSIAWSPDGNSIASAGYDKTVQIWNAETGDPIRTYQGHTNYVTSIAWSPDGKRLASASYDGTVQIWNASNGSLAQTYKGHSGRVYALAWSPDGKQIASGGDDQIVRIWNALTGQTSTVFSQQKGSISSIAWSPDGKRIASASYDKTVQVWDPNKSHVYAYTAHTDYVYAVTWSPDSQYIASASADHTVHVWKPE